MKRTEYYEHIEQIRCSDEFKEKMERLLVSSSDEMHEYEESVRGVERVPKFNTSRFAALAASLIIICGGVGLGMHGVKNIEPLDTTSSMDYEENNFPYTELFELHSSQQVHGDVNWENHNEKINEDLVETLNSGTGEMTNEQLDLLFSFFDMNSWNTVEARDMSDTKGVSNLSFVLHPDGYERFTGVYYIFQIFDNDEAYFIKYDMADDSNPDHIVSEYCYMFTEGTYERYREVLRAEDYDTSGDMSVTDDSQQLPPFGSLDGLKVQQIAAIGFSEENLRTGEKEVIEEASNEIMDILRNFPWQTATQLELTEENMVKLGSQMISIVLDESNRICVMVQPDGKLATYDEDRSTVLYDAGTEIYDKIRAITEKLSDIDSFRGEIASQEEIDSIINKNVKEDVIYSVKLPLQQENDEIIASNSTQLIISNLDSVKDKMKSLKWEKGSIFAILTEEYNSSTREYVWHDTPLIFNEKGILFDGNNCYRITDEGDIAEIIDLLNENIDSASPQFKLTESLRNCNFRNMEGSYTARFTVPALISDTGQKMTVRSEGKIYVDNENNGVYAEASATVNNDSTQRYVYLKYPDGRVRYDQAKGEGESVAHCEGTTDFIPVLDYAGLYTQVLKDIETYKNTENRQFMNFKNNPDGTHTYDFTWLDEDIKTKTFSVTVDEQGKIMIYTKKTGETVECEIKINKDDCVFDSDKFSMPDMYDINK